MLNKNKKLQASKYKDYLISKFLASMFQNISIGTATVLSECI